MKRVLFMVLATVLMISCSQKAEPEQPAAVVAGLKIETLQTSVVDDYYEAVGTVQAKNRSVVAAKVMGNIVALHVREGDVVRAGQTLVEIDNRDAGIQLQKTQAGMREVQESLEEVDRSIRAAESARTAARASEKLAKTTLERYETLFQRRSVSPQEFDEVRTKYEIAAAESEQADRLLQATAARRNQTRARIDQAKADVANARVYVGYSRIAAPISGVVVSKQADVGYMATPGMPLLTIENSASYQLHASVEESKLGTIHLNDQVHVLLEALGNTDLIGTVEEIVPAADPATRSHIVKIAVANAGNVRLWSGLYGKARFVTGQRKILSVPQTALAQQGQLAGVFVVDQSGVARLRLVKTGRIFGDRIELLSGLNDGEQIVSEGIPSLRDGVRVREATKEAQRIAGR
ncbi:MAG TPA: efflux RND transporter periplasmic adaptor subunit [Pyrinomonadaceae bacterium]|nr:efflux RND transporter periplasmic adaptor subunit [Pyrinomonadaceae bacterium]